MGMKLNSAALHIPAQTRQSFRFRSASGAGESITRRSSSGGFAGRAQGLVVGQCPRWSQPVAATAMLKAAHAEIVGTLRGCFQRQTANRGPDPIPPFC